MSFVIAAPESVTAAASDLANIGSAIRSANAAASVSTSNVLSAAEDELSTAIASLFGVHGQAYQALSAQAAAFHQEFVQLMSREPPMSSRCRPSETICSNPSMRPLRR